jgi:hypothetical protein
VVIYSYEEPFQSFFKTDANIEVGINSGSYYISLRSQLGYDREVLCAVIRSSLDLDKISIQDSSEGWQIVLKSPTVADHQSIQEQEVQLRRLDAIAKNLSNH